jgi:hypothetical protein
MQASFRGRSIIIKMSYIFNMISGEYNFSGVGKAYSFMTTIKSYFMTIFQL